MGFDNISSTSTPGGNVFINSSSSVTAATIQTWLNGDSFPTTGVRRTYIGIAKGGTSQVALIPGITQGFDPDPLRGDNGFCPVTYTADDIHSAGYPSTGFVFTYPAAWFATTAVTDPGAEVDATYIASTGGHLPLRLLERSGQHHGRRRQSRHGELRARGRHGARARRPHGLPSALSGPDRGQLPARREADPARGFHPADHAGPVGREVIRSSRASP